MKRHKMAEIVIIFGLSVIVFHFLVVQLCIAVFGDESPKIRDKKPPQKVERHFGVLPEGEKDIKLKKSLPKLSFYSNDWKGTRSFIWNAVLYQRDGQHLPTFRQEIGDCVAAGVYHAVNYLQFVQIIDGTQDYYEPIYVPYVYGTCRVLVGEGRAGRSDGAVAIWAAEAIKKYGVISSLEADLEPYNGNVCRRWGYFPGPEKKWLEIGKNYPIKSYFLAKSAEEVCCALYNGCTLTTASGVGFEGRSYEKNNRVYLSRGGNWPHQMAIIGYDDTIQPLSFYIINSWGEDAHPKPKNNEPPGGFWITKSDLEVMIKDEETFWYSSFDGFKIFSSNSTRQALECENVEKIKILSDKGGIGK